MNPSKLIPVIPLLRADNDSIPKQEIIDRFLKDAKTKSARELKQDAQELKIQYGLVKEKKEPLLEKRIEKFLNRIPDVLTEQEWDAITNLLSVLEEIVKQTE